MKNYLLGLAERGLEALFPHTVRRAETHVGAEFAKLPPKLQREVLSFCEGKILWIKDGVVAPWLGGAGE